MNINWMNFDINRLTLFFGISMILLLVPLCAYSQVEVDYDATKIFIKQTNIPKVQQQKMKRWLEHGVKVVELTLGKMPTDKLNVALVEKSSASEPVPFGQIIRGDANSPELNWVKLQVNSAWPWQSFIDDWTLYHELSHLYLPYLNYSAFWVNEGFATYMQNVSMLKSDVIGKATFSKTMRAGLERGREGTLSKPGELGVVSADMWRKHAYMRVYWSGVAFFVEIDSILIQQGKSLTGVVAQYSRCCLVQESTGEGLMQQLDVIGDTDVFYQTYRRYINRKDFPGITTEKLDNLARYYSLEGDVQRY